MDFNAVPSYARKIGKRSRRLALCQGPRSAAKAKASGVFFLLKKHHFIIISFNLVYTSSACKNGLKMHC